MRTMKNTYCVEVAFLNTDSDDINVEYVESIGYNARQAGDYAVEYIKIAICKLYYSYINRKKIRKREGLHPLFLNLKEY